eukprot:TRINITY_DN29713_c0_g1_i1.p1 TRINITY_DN29713_c0_g1~~TRINITY_DN29713_c0_g1_i1.p1  ORF type:complete len:2168 (+),score=1020.31 TRINITY_DN29713_c0_g1_i1:168-6506(+)
MRERPAAPGDRKRKQEDDAVYESSSKRLKRGQGILDMEGAAEVGTYVPKNRETKQAWEEFLNNIQPLLGDDEQQALRECAEESLAVLRNTSVADANKRKEVEDILDIRVSDDFFHKILHLSKRMTDFVAPGAVDEDDEDAAALTRQEEVGASVQFEQSDDESYDDIYGGGGKGESNVAFEASDSEDEDMGDDRGHGLKVQRKDGEDDGDVEMGEDYVDAKAVDAHWIQRTMGKLDDNEDPMETQQRAEQVLEYLADAGKKDEVVETALTNLFQYQKFDFIKQCLNNRVKIVWCTKLARAKGDAKDDLMAELRAEPYGQGILDELAKGVDTADEETRAFRKEIAQQDQEREQERQGALLDLKDLAFDDGAQTITNQRTQLPKGSTKAVHKGYEEFHIPAFKKREVQSDNLVGIEKLPAWCHPGFKGMKSLNPMQSTVYPGAFLRDDNILVCAPTGAGKTNVAMMTIMREVSKCVVDGEIDEDKLAEVKIVYVAPMKALVQEVVQNFTNRLKDFDMTVAELTGDVMMTKAEFVKANVIVTTPEKWDIVTRKAGEKTYMQKVKLIIIDEVHLLHDTRGPVLEAIVARTLRMSEQTQELTRLVGLSATLPNYEDVATFMRVRKSSDPAENGLYYFDASHRPVPLEQQFIGISEKKPMKRRAVMNDVVFKKVMEQAGKQQMIIFVHSRKDTVATAKAVRDRALEEEVIGKFVRDDEARKELLLTEAENMKDPGLQNLLPYGFGVHHAGLTKEDRATCEYLFDKGHLQVLVSTATLAWGVNLPAHCVIIKGTQIYNPEKGRWCELSPLDVIQMIGRAGRPQYDTKGEGIVITGQSELQFYLSLLNRQLPIESHFINKLVDQLNAEVAMGSVQNAKEGVEWLAYTYLYVRMLRNPELYRVSMAEAKEDPSLEQRRADLIHSAAQTLDKAALIRYDRRSGLMESTDLGLVCANYYLSAGTIIKFNEHLKPTMHELDLFRLFAMADEFQYMSVRAEEKMELARLLEQVPVPVKEGVDDPLAKTNVLLQAYISQLKLDGFALMADMVYITQSASRVIRAMFEMVLRKGWAQLSEKLLNMAKMVEKRTWLSHSPLRQFKNISLDVIQKLERKDFSWDRYYNLTPQDIATLVDNPKESKKIYKAVHQIPRLDINATAQPITRSLLRIELLLTADFQFDAKVHGAGESFHIIVEDPDQEQILHTEPFILQEKYASEEHYLYFHVPIFDPMPPQYFVRVVSDRWMASESALPVSFRRLILPEKSFSHTQLLDLTALPISALENPSYEALYPHIKHLNAIQTQVFQALHKGDENALVAAPAGSGKTFCAELALLRLFNESQGKRVRAVYCAPNQDTVDVVYKDWRRKFGDGLGKSVVLLTGETLGDLKLLEAGEVIMCTAQQWDQLSRRWQRRKNVTSVRLFIADECHMLSTRNGPALEIVVSRMRCISAQLKDHKIRIVALSHSLLHARDIGLWIGSQPQTTTFNFHPSARPVALDIQIKGFGQPGFSARTMAMYKPAYQHIKNHARNRPVIIFTPSKRVTYDMVIELLTLCASDPNPKQFLHCEPAEIEPHVDLLTDKLLKKAFGYGIGFLEEGMASIDKKITSKLFDSDIGILQVLVVPYTMCHQLDVSAYMVVMAGTQFYDGKEFRHADYYLSDMLQMLGRAGRMAHDNAAAAYVMCHAPQREYLKRVLNDFYPVESLLDGAIIDHFNAEVVAKTIEGQQDAIDYLTWTFLYRRLRQNPNFYKMFGTSHEHISEYMSELVENSMNSLEQAGCITVAMEDGEEGEEEVIEAANLGRIAAYYYIQYSTIELFASSVKDNSKIRQLIEVVSSATEFEEMPIRHHEDRKLERLSRHCGIKQQNLRFNEPATKVSLLLHAHFSRRVFSPELMNDLQQLLPRTVPLLCSLADVIGSERWLTPLLNCMELSQMVVQGLWDRDSPLLQLPHFTTELARKCKAAGVETILDLVDMDDEPRNELLQFTPRQMNAVATACAAYPNIEVSFQVPEADDLHEGSPVRVVVTLQRDLEDDEPVPKVYAPLFPQDKEESWWLVVGDKKANYVHAFKKVTVQRKHQVAIDFTAPKEGAHNLHIFFMCDCYLGVDQELDLKLRVGPPEESDEEDEEDEEK